VSFSGGIRFDFSRGGFAKEREVWGGKRGGTD